jgi:hypothetical protein
MARMIDHTFQKSAILKLLKLATCPSLRLRHNLQGMRVGVRVDHFIECEPIK